MAVTVVIADGGVASLLACAVLGERAATGPAGHRGIVAPIPLEESDFRVQAARAHAGLFGLEIEPLRDLVATGGDLFESSLRLLLEASLLVRRLGGGEVVWPVSSPGQTGADGPDVAFAAACINRAMLLSQLVSVTDPGPAGMVVRVSAPYADLTERQLADLALDMDLPVWMCWWMAASEHSAAGLREQAASERARWTALFKEAGWTGSLEARAAVKPMSRSGVRTGERA